MGATSTLISVITIKKRVPPEDDTRLFSPFVQFTLHKSLRGKVNR
ncbi:hypothetical protein KUC_0148 [Vreelandella boliviensis LC1]|uniref:Uncharacterized protein n=1 Tax=Vreelandella boliviensis LC1 TaxID=1072583 RepID=A0A7U9C278_9GAMM|nr:hypothetical protein KUC_0148 [Halomonas boliviensis LC1]